ncbi:DUF1292 domain-containing protein [Haloimpatiens sp. FM7330]|uniref:DUF1292 domain-containing protein n=1 Tax=Haloimpatiens sp. FM7330 TaxID=3298610 RepID=UPI003635073B
MNKEKEQQCNCGENCECGCDHEQHNPIFVELEDEKGNVVQCEVVDGFVYKENEYAIVQNPEDGVVYLFKVVGEDEEVGELVVPNDEEFEEVRSYYEQLVEEK